MLTESDLPRRTIQIGCLPPFRRQQAQSRAGKFPLHVDKFLMGISKRSSLTWHNLERKLPRNYSSQEWSRPFRSTALRLACGGFLHQPDHYLIHYLSIPFRSWFFQSKTPRCRVHTQTRMNNNVILEKWTIEQPTSEINLDAIFNNTGMPCRNFFILPCCLSRSKCWTMSCAYEFICIKAWK